MGVIRERVGEEGEVRMSDCESVTIADGIVMYCVQAFLLCDNLILVLSIIIHPCLGVGYVVVV